MAAHRFTLLDVFTARPLTGNGLAVIHDADGLDDETMLAVARETRLSETSFVQSPSADGADYRHRIWMMTGEIPFAGHPSLGTAVAVARERGERECRFVQQTHAGLQPIDVRLDGDAAEVSMLQEPPRWDVELDPAEVLPMVGLDAGDADERIPAQVVSTGANQVLVCVRDPEMVVRAQPDFARTGELIRRHEAIVYYLFAIDPAAGRVKARSFIDLEVGEDPATGAAAGPVCAHVARHTGCERVEIEQGVEIHRPSVLRAAMEADRPRVGGDVVVVLDGTLRLDT